MRSVYNYMIAKGNHMIAKGLRVAVLRLAKLNGYFSALNKCSASCKVGMAQALSV